MSQQYSVADGHGHCENHHRGHGHHHKLLTGAIDGPIRGKHAEIRRMQHMGQCDAQHQEPRHQRKQRKTRKIDGRIGIIGRAFGLAVMPQHDGADSQPEKRNGNQHAGIAGEAACLAVIHRAHGAEPEHIEANLLAACIQNAQVAFPRLVRMHGDTQIVIMPGRLTHMRHIWSFHFQPGAALIQGVVQSAIQRDVNGIGSKYRQAAKNAKNDQRQRAECNLLGRLSHFIQPPAICYI